MQALRIQRVITHMVSDTSILGHGRAAQVEAWSNAPPPPNPADADDARPLRASETHSKIVKTSPRAAGRVAGAPSAYDARRLALK